ncbi:MAG: LPS assembly lipoprotein LptE [Pseudomonadota bacterium]
MKATVILLFCLLLGGCGYHLLVPTATPEPIHVTVRDSGAPRLAATLRQRLQLHGLMRADATARRTVTVRAESTDQRLLAIDSAGRAAEYREEHAVQARAHWTGEQPGDWRDYSAIRDYAYDASVVLGKDQERQLILEEMRVELADRIIENLVYDAVHAVQRSAEDG